MQTGGEPPNQEKPMSINRRELVALGLAAAAAPRAWSQVKLPDTMRIVMPYPPGGALDGTARVFAQTYAAVNGRSCIVDNKPGAATIIGASDVMRSKPDGSTVLWTTGGHTTNAVLMKKLPFDPIEDFTPVTMLYDAGGFALMTRANGPFNSVADVVAAAKKAPGKVSYASAGNGNTTHVVGALFAKMAGIDLLHVPYKGTPLTDLISGQVDLTFVAASSMVQYIQAGKLKALAITGAKRSPSLPDVPTLAETGIKEVDVPAYICMLAPPKMPADVLAALHESVVKTLRDPGFVGKMKDIGNEVSGMPPQQFKAYMVSELARYRRVLPPLGIQMDT
jgi:tripartite-type tricarboxylate transporter receptor subunit TctC